MPLSSQAVKPWSAPNFSWSTRSLPAWFSNMPKWGAYLRRKGAVDGAASALRPPTATAAPAARVVFSRSRRFIGPSILDRTRFYGRRRGGVAPWTGYRKGLTTRTVPYIRSCSKSSDRSSASP